MYLCIGVLLTLLTKFKKGRSPGTSKTKKEKLISNEDICNNYLFATSLIFPDEAYTQQKISPIINCKPNSHLKRSITNYFDGFDIYNPKIFIDLHRELSEISDNIISNVLNPNYVKAFIESLYIIIKYDDSISDNTIIGINPEYTKANILTWTTFDINEFLLNIFYYTCTHGSNEKGADTLLALNDAFIEERIKSLNYISLTNASGTQSLIFNLKQSKGSTLKNILSRELTDTMVINSTAENVLFREKEYEKILDLLENKHKSNIFLHGMGGCGKTSLARMLYCHLKNDYDHYGWINYSGDIRQSMIASINLENYRDKTMIENDTQKKWQFIKRELINTPESKLLVIDNVDNIDGVQTPRTDKDLIAMSSWSNTTIIITSRLSDIPGYSNSYLVNNLGDENNYEKCVELFYHYNPNAANKRLENDKIVQKLCALAGYNTMVIELLAKGSIYLSHSLDRFYHKLINKNFSCANDIPVETDHDYTLIETNKSTDNYYDIGNETVASQIYKLFNLKTRNPIQQLILWDFHCLPENKRVSIDELNNWMGFKTKDIIPLIKEGWIQQLDDGIFIHPLVNQAVSCSEQTSNYYWKIKKEMIDAEKSSDNMLLSISNNTFFNESDSFKLSLRKLLFVDCLTYHGDFLGPFYWINIADFARRHGNVNLGIFYYQKTYDYYTAALSFPNFSNIDTAQYWKCTYFYGYMLSYTKAGYKNAEKLIIHSLEIAENIIQDNGFTDNNILLLATSLDHLGYILSNSLNNDIERITKADFYLNEAVRLRYVLSSSRPEHYRLLHDYAWSLDNLGTFYANIDVDKVVFKKNSDVNDIKYLTLKELVYNKKKAKKILKDALEIRMALAKVRSNEDSTEVAWTCFNLASLLYAELNEKPPFLSSDNLNEYMIFISRQLKLQEAENYLQKALEIYKHLDTKFPGQHMSSQARTTALYGKLLKLWETRQNEACEIFNKALKLYTLLDNENPGMYKNEINSLKQQDYISLPYNT